MPEDNYYFCQSYAEKILNAVSLSWEKNRKFCRSVAEKKIVNFDSRMQEKKLLFTSIIRRKSHLCHQSLMGKRSRISSISHLKKQNRVFCQLVVGKKIVNSNQLLILKKLQISSINCWKNIANFAIQGRKKSWNVSIVIE